jgi:hypothetical protein
MINTERDIPVVREAGRETYSLEKREREGCEMCSGISVETVRTDAE